MPQKPENQAIEIRQEDGAKRKADLAREQSRTYVLQRMDLRVMEGEQGPLIALIDACMVLGVQLPASHTFLKNLVEYQTAKEGRGLSLAVDLVKEPAQMVPMLYRQPEQESLLSRLPFIGKKQSTSTGGDH